MLGLVPNAIVALFFLLSLIPIVPETYRKRSQLAAHVFLGFFYLFAQNSLLGITVTGSFNSLHSFLQAYVAPFHIGIALYLWLSQASRPQQSVIFARIMTSFFCLFTKLFAAWHLSEKSSRGLLITDYFVISAVLAEGTWFFTEIVRFVLNKTSMREEVDHMCKLTTLWLEGKGSQYIVNALYADAALCFTISLLHFAFPQQILKLVIKSEHILDSHHIMWCRLFGVLSLGPAIASLQARYFSPSTQIAYLLSRLLTQCVVFMLNIFGHWILAVYSPNHITSFMVSGFYMSFLFSSYFRARKHYEDEPRKARPETRSVKKTN